MVCSMRFINDSLKFNTMENDFSIKLKVHLWVVQCQSTPQIYLKLKQQFETNILNDYKRKYNKLPGIWLTCIDDMFSLGMMTKQAENIL